MSIREEIEEMLFLTGHIRALPGTMERKPRQKRSDHNGQQSQEDNNAMTVVEVAKSYNFSEKLVYKMVKKGTIPHTRVEGVLRFDRQAIEKWWEEPSVTPRKRR
jgi:excisionase family DNA binding protein